MKLIPMVVLAIATLRASPLTAATIDITAGNNPSGTEQNVILDSSGPATTVTGHLSDTPGLLVNFISLGGNLVAPSNGQARIEAASASDPLPSLLIQLSGGYTFTDLIFNAFGAGNQDAGTATVVATGNSTGAVSSNQTLSNGQNFITVRATGDTLASVRVSAPGAVDLRQVRVSGVAPGGVVVSAVPEPGTLALLAAGILPFILFRRKKQS